MSTNTPHEGLPVFLSCDDRFLPHTLTTIASVLEHSTPGTAFDFTILTTGVSQASQDRALAWFTRYRGCSLRFCGLDEKIDALGRERFQVTGQFPLAAYFRLFAPSLFSGYSRMLYLDSDVIVCDDIVPLFSTDLRGNLLAACEDLHMTESLARGDGQEATFLIDSLGLQPGDRYVNSGVLLLDLDAMRQNETEVRFIKAIDRIRNPLYADQDIINAVCRGQIHFLDDNWNVHDWCADPTEKNVTFHYASPEMKTKARAIRKDCRILHYTGKKPWTHGYEGSLADVYWRYAALTPFYDDVKATYRRELGGVRGVGGVLKVAFHLARSGAGFLVTSGKKREKNRRRCYFYRQRLGSLARALWNRE